MKKVDFIIVGQGIAGSMLAYYLAKRKSSFIVIDKEKGGTASRQATGMVNPITGRRFVKSWMIDEVLPMAYDVYCQFSAVKKTTVHKVLHSIEQINDYELKKRDERYQKYLVESIFTTENPQIINPLGCIKIAPVLQIDTAKVIDDIRIELSLNEQIVEEDFEYESFLIKEKAVQYKDFLAKKIIFCQGVRGHQNPYFNHLPLKHAKGEVLHFEAKDLSLDCILSSYANIVPLEKGIYSIGATYDWDDVSFLPTKEKREDLEEKLQRMIKCSYKIIEQKAGIRPTTIDRRPLIGVHPEHKDLYIFNGMGTKGLSLSPYFAEKLIEHLLDGVAIPQEVDIKRFDK